MTSVAESTGQKSELAAGLAAGIDVLSLSQEITFLEYARYTLPLDGSVFWVRTETAARAWKGSFHYATDTQQLEDENVAKNRVVFTSLFEINDLNDVDRETLWISEHNGLRVAFSSRKSFYKQADLYHYVGDVIYPALASQILESADDIDDAVVVSNSLPVWLTLTTGETPVYPSFLVPANIEPPYIAVHIEPAGTTALQPIGLQNAYFVMYDYVDPGYVDPGYVEGDIKRPLEVEVFDYSQLAKDKVRVTMYGLRNAEALDYLRAVLEYSANMDIIGLMNGPVIRDEKRTQTEFGILAQKKTCEFEVSYYQSRVYQEALRFIRSSTVNFFRG